MRNDQMHATNQYSRDRYVRQAGVSQPHGSMPQGYGKIQVAKPVNPTVLAVLGIVAAILVAIIALRFVLIGPTALEFESIQSDIRNEQSQITELNESNDELQGQIDSWQTTIEEYNARKS